MPWNKYGSYKEGDENVRELHILSVYSDPDFIADVSKLGAGGGAFIANTFSAEAESLLKAKNPNVLTTEEIMQKYCITLDELMHYKLGPTGVMPLPNKELPFNIDWDEYDNNDFVTVKIKVDMTDDDFTMLRTIIRRQKQFRHNGKYPRGRKIHNPALVYAIFKQRHKLPPELPVSFGKITKMYKNGELPHYDGEIKKTMTVQNLTREYNRYNPEKL